MTDHDDEQRDQQAAAEAEHILEQRVARDILRFVKQRSDQGHIAPTRDAIAAAVGCPKSTVFAKQYRVCDDLITDMLSSDELRQGHAKHPVKGPVIGHILGAQGPERLQRLLRAYPLDEYPDNGDCARLRGGPRDL